MRAVFLIALLLVCDSILTQPTHAQSADQGPGPMPAGLQPPPRFLGKDLQALCEGPENGARLSGCLRYLQGAVAMYEVSVAEAKDLSLFCAPREAPAALLRQQYMDWAKENGDQMNQDAIQTVKQALVEAFPCQGD